jgi:predicted transcriptional regulator
MQTRVLTAHVPIDLAKQLDRAAARLERSRGWIVQKALADWIVVDDKVVRAWAAGLGKEKAKKR